jgi:hypothetical protein
MSTPSAAGSPTAEDLLDAAGRLSPSELDRFVPEVIALRARRAAPVLGDRESELLTEIGRGLPDELRQPYTRLVRRRDARTLTPGEHEELVRLSDAVETFQARRLELLMELAQARGITLETILGELGISPLPNV